MSTELKFDVSRKVGSLKPMNAVNNGPSRPMSSQSRGNFEIYSAAGFPYARTHDANHCTAYGAPHTIDVSAIFPNFDADENDPASYDFVHTDEYLDTIIKSGTKVFYRLGQSIEHGKKKYDIFPPKDYNKWARICEHIILHLNEGWADGRHFGIEYWEIWNEPDLNQEDYTMSPTWQGTKEQFFDFYEVAAKHLKSKFPHLKIGGPAVAWFRDWAADFLAEMQKRSVPMDFFSWHRYDRNPRRVGEVCQIYRDMLDSYGYTDTESILNEWNYVRTWDVDFVYSLKAIASIKGAAYATAMMCECQNRPLDMLMYYDARIGVVWNGLFDIISLEKGKTYYPYFAFNQMSLVGDEVSLECDNTNVYALAVSCEERTQLLLTYYNEEDGTPSEDIEMTFFAPAAGEMRFYLTDIEKNDEPVKTVKIEKGEQTVSFTMKLFDIYNVVIDYEN